MSGLVKHYQNTMQGIPQLSNNWGSMINLLDAVLVNGFNYVPVISVSKSTTTAITATINLGSGHGFIDGQVVRIAGSENGWNGDYKVLSADTASITIECSADRSQTIIGTASCFTAPLDFEIVYQTPSGSITPKRAYRSTSPEATGLILLVHDFCVSGASEVGAKFAKVGVVASMSDIDNITGIQMPYNQSAPDANWGWDGVYHGWAKWYYRTAAAFASDATEAAIGNSEFHISGNAIHFAYTAKTPGVTSGAFLEFDDVRFGGKNLALVAQGVSLRISQAQSVYLQGRSAFNFPIYPDSYPQYGGYNLKALVYFDETGQANYQSVGKAVLLKAQDGNGLDTFNTSGAPLLIQYPLTTSNGVVIGGLPFFKFGSFTGNTTYTTINGKVVTFQQANSSEIFSKFAMTLEVE